MNVSFQSILCRIAEKAIPYGTICIALVVTLTAEGALFMNNQPVPLDGLRGLLDPHPRESSVLVRADRVTVLDRFVSVVDEIRSLGFQQVNLEVVRS